MAKKAAALQSFQKCEIQNISIPATILEDVEIREEGEFDTRSLDGREGERRKEEDTPDLLLDSQHKVVCVEEPSDRIELVASQSS